MGEAKRRAKLDSKFGQNYPAQDKNWVFHSANDEVVTGTLNDCLSLAGITNSDDYQDQYIKPLTKVNLSRQDRSKLFFSMGLDRRKVDDDQYQTLFYQAVKTGSIFVVFDDDYPDECCHHIYHDPYKAQLFRR